MGELNQLLETAKRNNWLNEILISKLEKRFKRLLELDPQKMEKYYNQLRVILAAPVGSSFEDQVRNEFLPAIEHEILEPESGGNK